MKGNIYALFLLFLVVFSRCSFDELPSNKSLRTCRKPDALITPTPDPANFLRYTFTLSNVSGDVETVAWTVGNTTETRPPGESYVVTFTQPGEYSIRATLQNGCNNNATVQLTITVMANTPLVSTGTVDNIGQTTATARLTVTRIGSGTISEHGLIYSTDSSRALVRQGASFAAGTGSPTLNNPVTISLTNLSPGQKYFYRAYMRNSSGGEAYGAVQSFSTQSPTATLVDTWVRTFGGSNADFGYAILPMPGGYLIAGNTASNNGDVTGNKGSYDAWIARLDFNGTIIWQRTMGGSGDDILRAITPTSDGNYVLVGNTASSNGDVTGNLGGYDAWLVKINQNGNTLWQRTNGTGNDDFAFGVYEAADGGLVVAGYTATASNNRQAWVKRTNAVGAETGVVNYPNAFFVGLARATSGEPLATGSVGTTASKLNLSATKNTAQLNGLWNQNVGGPDDDGGQAILPTAGGGGLFVGYTVTGSISAGTWGPDFFAVLYNSSGGIVWQRSFGGSRTDIAQSVVATSDGGYLLVGSTESGDRDVTGHKGGSDIWVVKLNNSGGLVWQRTVGGPGNDIAYSVQATPDGGYILLGNTTSNSGDVTGNRGNNDLIVVKFDGQGNFKR